MNMLDMKRKIVTLAELKNGEVGTIIKIRGKGSFRKRITEMGFIKGKKVTVIKNAPLKDPVEYKLMDYNISLRRSEASLIDVLTDADPYGTIETGVQENDRHKHDDDKKIKKKKSKVSKAEEANRTNKVVSIYDNKKERKNKRHKKKQRSGFRLGIQHRKEGHISVALVGNPNCGKTTIFNHASGSRERVGNYGGVTIDSKEAQFTQSGYTFDITDLPGTYSITEYTPEELFVRDHIMENRPDVVINVIDASNLERNLYLTTQLIDMDIMVIIALNMSDELEQKGDRFDHVRLGTMIGIPFVPTVGPRGTGIRELFDKVIEVHEGRDTVSRHVHVNYGIDIERSIEKIESVLCGNYPAEQGLSTRYLAVKLLEKDHSIREHIKDISTNHRDILKTAREEVDILESELKEDSETLIADAKYGFITGALRETYRPAVRPRETVSERIDHIITHPLLGFPIFLFFMWLTFQLTFTLGQYPMDLIEAGVGALSRTIMSIMPAGLLRELIVDGIIAGSGGVIVFIPNILILFFMISLMEDTGYLARAAFIMDRLMHTIGLHGKSFIPLIMGFGCNVPAIMATRTLESRKDRLLTMLIIPFMSCSARLPVFVLFIGAFFPNHPGTMLFALYITGILVGIGTATIMKKTVFRQTEAPFVMELPPYRTPHLKNSLRHMWERGREYVKKIGGIVLIAAILIWALGRFPRNAAYTRDYDGLIKQTRSHYALLMNKTPRDPSIKKEMREKIDTFTADREREHLEQSYIGTMGKAIMPVLDPLGFDWKMGVSILTGLAAKEIAVSTLGILYHSGRNSSDNPGSLATVLKNQTYAEGPRTGQKIFSPLVALGYMMFILLYLPCAATMITMRRESGSWRWPVLSAVYSISMAWLAAFVIQQVVGRLL